MSREPARGWTGGYVGLVLLAALLTLGVMLVLFTDSQGSSPRVEVGDLLSQPCTGGDTGFDTCYAILLRNTSQDQASGRVTCTLTDPIGGRAKFVNDEQTYVSEPIPADGNALVLVRVRTIDGPTGPPVVHCEPGAVSATA